MELKIKIWSKKEKKQAKLDEYPKHGPISKTYNLWNPRPWFNQETLLSTNLILKDKIT
jgi:hypothetical protein